MVSRPIAGTICLYIAAALAGALLVGVVGCSGPQPKVYVYEKDLDLTLVCADPDSVNRSCRGGKADNGTVITNGTIVSNADGTSSYYPHLINACWKPLLKELWMPWGYFCDLLAHELCHADGQDQKFCGSHFLVEKTTF